MFKNYLKIAFRNLWKNRGYNIINILGMALGFAAFLLILSYINYERSYDKIFPNHQEMVKAGINDGSGFGSTMSAGFGPLSAQQFPEIKSYTRMSFSANKGLWTANDKSIYIDNLYDVDSTFFKIFQYPFLYGDPEQALDKPNSIVISDKISRQFFGNQNPIGQTIVINKNHNYMVSGVFKTPDAPTTFRANAFEKLQTRFGNNELFPRNFYTFFHVSKGANVPVLEKKLASFVTARGQKIDPEDNWDKVRIHLDPITQMHFSDLSNGHAGLLTMLLIIGIILLLIASVNFVNLSVATALGRAKEVGMRKVMGAGKLKIRLQFYFEIFIQLFIAYLLANILAILLKPAYASFLGLTSLTNSAGAWNMALYEIATLLLITFLAGAYPAFYLSRFDPFHILKGNFSRGRSGTFTQRLLLISQITLTTIFLVGVMIMARQVSYLKDINLGFQPDQVLTIPIHTEDAYKKYRSLKTELLNVSGITSVSRVSNLPGHGFGGNDYQYKDITQEFNFLCVGYDFAKTMGMQFIEGRGFDPQRDPDTLRHIILNQSAVKSLGITGDPVGQYLNRGQGWAGEQIIGVIKNFHYGSLQNQIQPLVFQLHWGNRMPHILVRVHTKHLDQTLANIKTIWNRYEPGFPVTYTFLDHYFDKFLNSFQRQERTVFVFALLAVLLSLFGLFALVAFSVRNRRKEVAVRKVLGASNGAILALLNRNFIRLVIGGSVLGWPLAYLAARHWLNGFAYRIDMPVWPFIIAAVVSVALTIITVSLVSWRAARANPMKALKYE